MNTKDYGLPQNRERVFLIGIRNDLPNTFVFPKKIPLELRLKDVLEDEVDEKYYLSDKLIQGFISHTEKHKAKGNGFEFKPTDGNCISKAITTRAGTRVDDNYLKVPSATTSGYEIATEVRPVQIGQSDKTFAAQNGTLIGKDNQEAFCIRASQPNGVMISAPTQQMLEINENGTSNCLTSVQKDNLVIKKFQEFEIADYRADEGLRIRIDGISPRLNSSIRDAEWTPQAGTRNPPITSNGYRIRKLTPLECFRLQGFPDSYIKPVSNSQLYKQAGNSISVPVIQAILKNLLTV